MNIVIGFEVKPPELIVGLYCLSIFLEMNVSAPV